MNSTLNRLVSIAVKNQTAPCGPLYGTLSSSLWWERSSPPRLPSPP